MVGAVLHRHPAQVYLVPQRAAEDHGSSEQDKALQLYDGFPAAGIGLLADKRTGGSFPA